MTEAVVASSNVASAHRAKDDPSKPSASRTTCRPSSTVTRVASGVMSYRSGDR
jgi:hypothetical protein